MKIDFYAVADAIIVGVIFLAFVGLAWLALGDLTEEPVQGTSPAHVIQITSEALTDVTTSIEAQNRAYAQASDDTVKDLCQATNGKLRGVEGGRLWCDLP